MLLLLIVFTNVRLRVINSVVTIAHGRIHRRPAGLVRLLGRYRQADPVPVGDMNTGFYLVVLDGDSHHLAEMCFVFDRLTYGGYGRGR